MIAKSKKQFQDVQNVTYFGKKIRNNDHEKNLWNFLEEITG